MAAECQWCLNIFERPPRDFSELFALRSTLRMPDSAPAPVICDSCYQGVMGSANQHPELVPNFQLRNNLLLRG